MDLLLKLLSVCHVAGCGELADEEEIKMCSTGGAISFEATCLKNHKFRWSTSSQLGEKNKKMFKINVDIASYVVLCGMNMAHINEYFDHLSISSISSRFFHYFQATLIHKVVHMVWKYSQKKEVDNLKEMQKAGEAIDLSGDGRYDSPGNE